MNLKLRAWPTRTQRLQAVEIPVTVHVGGGTWLFDRPGKQYVGIVRNRLSSRVQWSACLQQRIQQGGAFTYTSTYFLAVDSPTPSCHALPRADPGHPRQQPRPVQEDARLRRQRAALARDCRQPAAVNGWLRQLGQTGRRLPARCWTWNDDATPPTPRQRRPAAADDKLLAACSPSATKELDRPWGPA
jgi:hypothetical protein